MVLSLPAATAAYKIRLRERTRAASRDRYAHAPVAWIQERARGFLYEKMRLIAQSVHDNRRTAVPSCHDAGKSWLSARICMWWLDSSEPGEAFVVTTAPSAKQVKSILWKEMRRVYVTTKMPGRMNQTEYWMNNEMVAMGRKPNDDDPTAFQGIHSRKVLVLMDEACGIPEALYIAANSLIANEFGRMLAIGNPDDPDSYFARICGPGSDWNIISISVFDTPNFTGIDAPQEVKDVLVNKIYEEEMRKDVGIDSPVYISKVLGRFPENKKDGVILLSWIRQCQIDDPSTYTSEQLLPVELGVDVGAGGDETSIRERRGIVAGRAWEAKTPQPEQAFALVVDAILECKPTRVKIDVIGIGWALLGMLRSTALRGRHYNEVIDGEIDISGIDFVPVNVGVAAPDPERFLRFRSQLWWECGREACRTKSWNLSLVDDLTVSQLTDPLWHPDLANRHVVETKQDTMKRTNKPSPNRADALLLAFCEPPQEEEYYTVVHYDPVEIGPSY